MQERGGFGVWKWQKDGLRVEWVEESVMSDHSKKEPWLEEWWGLLVIGLGIVLTLIFALYGPTA